MRSKEIGIISYTAKVFVNDFMLVAVNQAVENKLEKALKNLRTKEAPKLRPVSRPSSNPQSASMTCLILPPAINRGAKDLGHGRSAFRRSISPTTELEKTELEEMLTPLRKNRSEKAPTPTGLDVLTTFRSISTKTESPNGKPESKKDEGRPRSNAHSPTMSYGCFTYSNLNNKSKCLLVKHRFLVLFFQNEPNEDEYCLDLERLTDPTLGCTPNLKQALIHLKSIIKEEKQNEKSSFSSYHEEILSKLETWIRTNAPTSRL